MWWHKKRKKAAEKKRKENEPPPLPPASVSSVHLCLARLVLFIFVLFRFTTAIELLLFGGFFLSFFLCRKRGGGGDLCVVSRSDACVIKRKATRATSTASSIQHAGAYFRRAVRSSATPVANCLNAIALGRADISNREKRNPSPRRARRCVRLQLAVIFMFMSSWSYNMIFPPPLLLHTAEALHYTGL